MEWLNYHHLLYFWVVAKQGSIVRASEELRLAHPTISGQIHRLEEVLGEKLFTRRGRNLVLTESGRVAFRYADEIFSLGREFVDTLKGRASGKPLRLVVGVADVLPPSLVRRFLEPAFRLGPAGPGRLPGGQVRAGVPRRARAAQRGRRDRRRARRVRHPGARVQPPAGRVRDDVLRRPEAGRQAPAQVSPLARCGARSSFPARLRRFGARSSTGSTPRTSGRGSSPSWTTARSRRSSAKTAWACSRRPTVIESRDPPPLPGAGRRPRGGGSPAVLRDLGRAQDQAPGGGRHLRGGAPGHLSIAPVPGGRRDRPPLSAGRPTCRLFRLKELRTS